MNVALNKVDKLNRAKALKDDEFYTFYSDVSALFRAIRPYIMDYDLLLPFDSFQSNFVKFMKQNTKYSKYRWKATTNYLDFADDYKRSDVVVISNPPFSIKGEILDRFYKDGTKFVLILPKLTTDCCLPLVATAVDLDINRFKRPDKSTANVNTFVFSNFINFTHKVRYDKNCPHMGQKVMWSRGNIYWNCFLLHHIEVSAAGWMNPLITKLHEYEEKGKFKRYRISISDCISMYLYHARVMAMLEKGWLKPVKNKRG